MPFSLNGIFLNTLDLVYSKLFTIKGLTQLRRDFILTHHITNWKNFEKYSCESDIALFEW